MASRRATPPSEASSGGSSASSPVVRISRAEYDDLQSRAKQYALLRQNLLRSGIGDDNIAALCEDFSTKAKVSKQTLKSLFDQMLGSRSLDEDVSGVHQRPRLRPRMYRHRSDSTSQSTDLSDDVVSIGDSSIISERPTIATQEPTPCIFNGSRIYRSLDRDAKRTILISNLSVGTILADVTAVIRGGQLLDIYLKRNEFSVAVSFVYEQDAEAFYEHVSKHGLYIRNQRVEVDWNERQFFLSKPIANKIESGSTRNLVVRDCRTPFTKDSIRHDLDHIHNLIVIKVDFFQGNCYISTNSISHAAFARTCMMSQRKYKGCRIEYDEDECEEPIEATPTMKPINPAPAPGPEMALDPRANPYAMLHVY